MFIAPLFDRLADTPNAAAAGTFSGVAGERRAQVDSIVRELQLLLNTHGTLAAAEIERFSAPCISVLNYGMPSLTGVAASAVNAGGVAERIRVAIAAFEPRLREVRVVALPMDPVLPELRFQVRGVLPGASGQAPVVLETQIGLGTGDVQVVPVAGG